MSFVGTLLLNEYLKNTYKNRKIVFENRIENFLNKKVDLGDYSGIRFLGISLKNSKIIDNRNLNCLLYTSDAADDTPCVDLGGRRIIKKKCNQSTKEKKYTQKSKDLRCFF